MKTNILFLMRYPLEERHHLTPKFDGQMQACVNLGYNVFFLGYDKKYEYLINYDSKEREQLVKTHFGNFNKYRNTFAFYDIYNALDKAIDIHEFKYIYMRSKIINWKGIDAIKKFKMAGGKLIVEVPAFKSIEKSLSIWRIFALKLLYHYNKQLIKYVDLYTLIGPDCHGVINGRPAINIVNGISIDNIPLRNYKPQKEIHILALASMRIWHAYDRLIRGLANYKGDQEIIVDMVGGDNDGSLAVWKRLVNDLNLTDKVKFHGPKYGKELSDFFDICDIGVATLGLHRNKMTRGSVLKLGEYSARGLPFIYGYNDQVLSGKEPFVYKVPEDETPLDVNNIIKWALKMRQNPNIAKIMRDFAQKNMSWETQFKNIFTNKQIL